MHNRIKTWMQKEGLKSSQFADKIGVNRATISHILSGRNKPSIDFFQKLLTAYPGLNANWFITGIGYMYNNQGNQNDNLSKSIKKIVVFFNDKSFDELKR